MQSLKKCVGYVLILFLWGLCLLICGYWQAGFSETEYNYFGHLGQSFMRGQLDTPQISGQLDVSTYNGKTYLYWGPAGGWLFSLGNMIFEQRISDRVVAAILLAANFYLWCLIVCELCRGHALFAGEFAVLLTFACLGGLFVTQFENPSVWQMGHILACSGMSLVVYGLVGHTLKLNTAVAGFCFAVLSRSSLLLLAPGLAWLAVVLLQRANKDFRQTARQMLIPLGLGLSSLAVLATYNYLRFDSIREFGQSYKSDIPFFSRPDKGFALDPVAWLAARHGTFESPNRSVVATTNVRASF